MKALTKYEAIVCDKMDEANGPIHPSALARYGEPLYCKLAEPTIRKALKGLEEAGLVTLEKEGRKKLFARTNAIRPKSEEEIKEEKKAEAQRAKIAAGEIGICQACLREIKMVKSTGLMVRHGWNLVSENYNRFGYHTGECLGQSEKPLNEDNTITLRLIEDYKKEIESTEGFIKVLEAGPETIFGKYIYDDEKKTHHAKNEDGTVNYRYHRVLDNKIREEKRRINTLKAELREYEEANAKYHG